MMASSKWISWGLFAVLLWGSAVANVSRGTEVEASLLVRGTIEIEPDGSVSGYSLDEEGKLPPGVAELLAGLVPTWRFDPVLEDGRAVPVSTRIHIGLRASRNENGDLGIHLQGVGFLIPDEESLSWRRRLAPVYPPDLWQANAQGVVYLLLKIGRDGIPQEIAVERVDLLARASKDSLMARFRKALADTSRRTAARWRFSPPTAGSEVDADFWLVRIPIEFLIPGTPVAEFAYGAWRPYVPGPTQPLPAWARSDGAPPEALVAGLVHQVKREPRLRPASADEG